MPEAKSRAMTVLSKLAVSFKIRFPATESFSENAKLLLLTVKELPTVIKKFFRVFPSSSNSPFEVFPEKPLNPFVLIFNRALLSMVKLSRLPPEMVTRVEFACNTRLLIEPLLSATLLPASATTSETVPPLPAKRIPFSPTDTFEALPDSRTSIVR